MQVINKFNYILKKVLIEKEFTVLCILCCIQLHYLLRTEEVK